MTAFRHIILIVCIMLLSAVPAAADEYVALAGPYVPFCVNKGLHTQGIAVDTFATIMDMTDTPFNPKKIKYLPWKKAYKEASKKSGRVLLGVPRTQKIENDYAWVGPICFPELVLVGKKGTPCVVESVADAAKYTIGAVRNGDAAHYLLAEGLPPASLKLATTGIQPLMQLKNGQVDLVAFSDMEVTYMMRRMRIDETQYDVVYGIKKIPLYFAFSKDTPTDRIKLFNEALAAYKKPSSEWRSPFDKNVGRYLPKGVVD